MSNRMAMTRVNGIAIGDPDMDEIAKGEGDGQTRRARATSGASRPEFDALPDVGIAPPNGGRTASGKNCRTVARRRFPHAGWVAVGFAVGPLNGCQFPDQKNPAAPVRGEGGETIRVTQADVDSARDAPEPKILPKTRYAAGRLFESSSRWEKAVEQYRKAVIDDPTFVEAYDRLGVILGYLGEHAEAERSLRRAVQLRPKSAELRNNLGFALILQRKWAEAENELRRAVELQRTFDRAYVNLGLVLAAKGDFDGAMTVYRKVLPESDTLYNMGLAYRAHRRGADARAAFTRVLAINPNFVAARKQLASMDGANAAGEVNAAPTDGAVATLSDAGGGTGVADNGRVQSTSAPMADAAPGSRPVNLLSDEVADEGEDGATGTVGVNSAMSGQAQPEPSRESLTAPSEMINLEASPDELAAERLLANAARTQGTGSNGDAAGSALAIDQAMEMLDKSVRRTFGDGEHGELGGFELDPGRPATLTGAVKPGPRRDFAKETGEVPPAVQSVALVKEGVGQRPVVIRRAGDIDGNGLLDSVDLAAFRACLNNAEGSIKSECEAGDMDVDGDLDLHDYIALQRVCESN